MRDEMIVLDGRRAVRRCRSQSPPPTTVVTQHRRQPQLPPNYFRRFFDTSGFDQETVRVSVERGTLVLGVDRVAMSDDSDHRDTTSLESGRARTKYFRFSIPRSVDLSTIRAVLSTDGVLLVEADTGTGTLSSPGQSLGSSGADSGGAPVTGAKREKIGKPVFREDDDGKRRMHLLVDVGDSFRPKDVYVQAIKSDRFQVCASTVYAVGLCLFVCLSLAGIVSKRLKLGSREQRRTIAQRY